MIDTGGFGDACSRTSGHAVEDRNQTGDMILIHNIYSTSVYVLLAVPLENNLLIYA